MRGGRKTELGERREEDRAGGEEGGRQSWVRGGRKTELGERREEDRAG